MFKKIPLEIYPFNFLVFIDENKKDIKKELSKYLNKQHLKAENYLLDKNCYDGIELFYSYGYVVINIGLTKDDNKFIGVLAHEVSHGVFDVMEYIGMPLRQESQEAYTYLIQYVINQVML